MSRSANKLHPTVIAAVSHILRPLVRLLLAHGVSFQTFSELARTAYVKVADEEFRLPAKSQTDSRISLLTGIQRREVNRLRNNPDAEVSLPEQASRSALLLAIWSGHPEYQDEHGSPAALPRLSGGQGRSFEAMVRSVSKDIRPRVVLDEWLRQGVVTLGEDDMVHLRADAFVQPRELDEKVYYFGLNIHDHLAATVHNLAGLEPPFLERCVFYDKLGADSVKELGDYSRVVGMRALQAINKRAAELQQRDRGQQGAVYRINFGVYNFSEVETHDDSSAN
jgi:hypothetical protein